VSVHIIVYEREREKKRGEGERKARQEDRGDVRTHRRLKYVRARVRITLSTRRQRYYPIARSVEKILKSFSDI